MKKLALLLTVGALIFVAVSVVFASRSVQAQSALSGDAQVQDQGVLEAPAYQAFPVTATPGPDDPRVPGATEVPMVEMRSQFCVRKIPYTLLALPENATFEVIAPYGPVPTPEPGSTNPNEYACSAALILDGKQIVVCTGPNDYSFSLRVMNDGGAEDFPVPLKACPIKKDRPEE